MIGIHGEVFVRGRVCAILIRKMKPCDRMPQHTVAAHMTHLCAEPKMGVVSIKEHRQGTTRNTLQLAHTIQFPNIL